MAYSTKAAYERGNNLFIEFCTELKVNNDWPPSLEQVVQFVACLQVRVFRIWQVAHLNVKFPL